MRVFVTFVLLSTTTSVWAQDFGSTSGASSAINITNPASTTSKNRLITPPTVAAPGGVSVMGGGVTFGSTKVDDGCTIRLLARQLFAFGFQKAAVALMCQDNRVAAAMDAAGSPCPGAAEAAHAEVIDRSPIPAASANPFMRDEQAWFGRASN